MNTRPLETHESDNLAALNRAGCNSVLLFITETGLTKHILDATDPMRRMFRDAKFHDYAVQGQGDDAKVFVEAFVLTDSEIVPVRTSLYRPISKHGDPRMWFSRFGRFAGDNDVCAVFLQDGQLYTINLTRSKIAATLAANHDNPVTRFLKRAKSEAMVASDELLGMLTTIAKKGPLQAQCEGDTAIGRCIETALGIQINSSRAPDFKGIEIKSGRVSTIFTTRKQRATLFGCVPDWTLSNLKSSRAILDKYGYNTPKDFRLYCTVSTRGANPIGLQLEVKEATNRLREFCKLSNVEEVCVWQLDELHKRLEYKHHETFWISASAIRIKSIEWFQLESVIHTSRPSAEQFDRLLGDGTISLDHLVKRVPSGRVSEKGPLFRIDRSRLQELFLGEPRKYVLLS